MANWRIIGSIIGGVLVLGAIGNAIDGNAPAGTPSGAASSSPRATADSSSTASSPTTPSAVAACKPSTDTGRSGCR